MEKGVQRWLVDISKWNPSPSVFSIAISHLPRDEHSAINRYVKLEDRKRAVVSRLLQHDLAHQVFELPYNDIIIRRTYQGKPFVELDCSNEHHFPNFNFNVSHQGDYVVLVSEPLCLIGVDVVSCVQPQKQTVKDFFKNFVSYISGFEWENIHRAGSSEEQLKCFFKYWSLKEAFVKAIGDGLSFELSRIEFYHTNWTDIWITVDGKVMNEWRFWVSDLPNHHLVSIAKGCPGISDYSVRKVLKHTGLDDDWSPFKERTVEELLYVSSAERQSPISEELSWGSLGNRES